MSYPFFATAGRKNRCAIILAGGSGVRLRSFVQKLRGDALPKQYVKLLSNRSMLETTLARAEKIVPSEQQCVVVTENHFDYPEVAQQLANFPKVVVAAQPNDRDTGVGMLFGLAHLYQSHPDSTVIVFPSDHFIQEEELFLAHVDAACRLVEQDHSKFVLLGVAPTTPETEFGYILPDHHWQNAFPFGARAVTRFIEKPDTVLASKLILQGGFWNTMVMVLNGKTLIEYVRQICPATFRSFESMCQAAGRNKFAKVINQVFAGSEPLNLSRGILQKLALLRERALLVLPVRGVHWNDWGREERIMQTLEHAKNCGLSLESSGDLFNSLLKRNVAGSA
ncbi:MAG TPA: sugar phosphate nucleotidyltransferase [Candidatus Binatus sp.]|nr:sugar phosphate nucleotidyltransferase [Candidatus Binatus sp.]